LFGLKIFTFMGHEGESRQWRVARESTLENLFS
jgi:hypothetical protein